MAMGAPHVPVLETERLVIRRFTMDDLDVIHAILDVDLGYVEGDEQPSTREERARWLQWTILGYDERERLYQPPYGDRAVVRKDDGRLIGACGYVPSLGPFEQIPYFRGGAEKPVSHAYIPEVGLYYAFARAAWGHGYATEAAAALVAHGFDALALKRIVATTSGDNERSMRVMQRLGMRIEHNEHPGWLQVVGVVENNS